MTDGPLGTDTTSIDEPVPAADPAGAGSSSSDPNDDPPRDPQSPTRAQDLGRALLCAVLVASCVATPELSLLLAPFVPVLVALRLLRRGGELRAFLVSASSAAVVAAVLAAREDAAVAPGIAMALLLVPALGVVHARAARRDPVVPGDQPAWPEPRVDAGFMPAMVAWLLGTILVVLLAAPAIDDPGGVASDRVRDQYRTYLDECTGDGAFAEQEELCDRLVEQRDAILRVVDEQGLELVGALVAAFAFGAAATAHLFVLWAARRGDVPVRPRRRLRELEVHWSAAYLVALGLAAWLVADLAGDPWAAWLRAAALVVGGVGAQLVMAQGLGLATWSLTRGRRPAWYWLMLGLVVLLTLTVIPVALFALGVLDLALHPRRRVAAAP